MTYGFNRPQGEDRPFPCPLCGDKMEQIGNTEMIWWGHTNEMRCPLAHVQLWTGEQIKQWNDRIRQQPNFGKGQPAGKL